MSPLTPVSNLHEFDPPPEYLRQGPEQPPPTGAEGQCTQYGYLATCTPDTSGP